jgi:hypothetical protein
MVMADAVTMLPLSKITLDPSVQPRAALNPETVATYVSDLKDLNAEFPPLTVYKTPQGAYLLADGWHRYHAYERAGHSHVPCRVIKGSVDDARLHAAATNVGFGLQRSVADRRRAVLLAIEHPLGGTWTDAQVSRHCCVSVPFVAAIRKGLLDLKAEQARAEAAALAAAEARGRELLDSPAEEVLERLGSASTDHWSDCGYFRGRPDDMEPEDLEIAMGKVWRLLRKFRRLATLLKTTPAELLRRFEAGEIRAPQPAGEPAKEGEPIAG